MTREEQLRAIKSTFTPAQYAESCRKALESHTVNEVNNANHYALDHGLCTLEQFQAAARVIAHEFLNHREV